MNKRAYSIIALAVLVGGSTLTLAQMAPNETRRLPYSGTLHNGATPESGDFAMRFGLFATEAESAACLITNPGSCPIWGEEQTVTVSAGAFAVTLGDAAAITDADLAQSALFLGIAVKGTDDGAFVLLPGKHEIVPVPWASRAAAAKDYKITGALTVGGTASVTGALSAGSVAAGSANLSGGFRANSNNGFQRGLDVRWNRQTGTGETDFINYHEGAGGASRGGFSFFDAATTGTIPATPLVTIRDNGNLSVSGDLKVGGRVFGDYASVSPNTDVVAATDGFVIGYIVANDDGDRGCAFSRVNNFQHMVACVHYFTGSDARVQYAPIMLPVKRGDTYRIEISNTSGELTWSMLWLPLAP